MTDQMKKFFKNGFNFELDLIKFGKIKISTAIRKIAGTNCSNPIVNYSKNS